MNIYIYGDSNFKTNVSKILDDANIELYLQDDQVVEIVDTLDELENLIQEQPTDAYLIDEGKIIKPKSLKFLRPKDGIEQEFLDDYYEPEYDFETIEELIDYIKNSHEDDDEDDEDYERTEMDKIKPQDISSIDDITDEYMLQALGAKLGTTSENKKIVLDSNALNNIEAGGLQSILEQLLNHNSLEITIKLKEQ